MMDFTANLRYHIELSREQIFELGKSRPFHKFVSFPLNLENCVYNILYCRCDSCGNKYVMPIDAKDRDLRCGACFGGRIVEIEEEEANEHEEDRY